MSSIRRFEVPKPLSGKNRSGATGHPIRRPHRKTSRHHYFDTTDSLIHNWKQNINRRIIVIEIRPQENGLGISIVRSLPPFLAMSVEMPFASLTNNCTEKFINLDVKNLSGRRC